MVPAVLLIEGSDFERFPAGGQLAMSRALTQLFGERLALVGMSADGASTGRWVQREISGSSHLFFSVRQQEPSAKRPFIPARLEFYSALRSFRKEILSLGCRAAFIQAPEALFAVSDWGWDSLCYWFAGVENPLKISRFKFAKPFWRFFDRAWFSALDRANLVLAAADENAINSLVSRSNGRLKRERLIQVPTCVDTSFFSPAPVWAARAELKLPLNCPVFVTVGRIGRLKGWELLLEALEHFLQRYGQAFFLFVGDGEDGSRLRDQIVARDLASKVHVTGFQNPAKVRGYLNAADTVVFGSFQEGWSVAMLEALACGKAIVSTQVSGAAAMIRAGQNGFIVEDRNPFKFAHAMKESLDLPHACSVSTGIAASFSMTKMGQTLARVWDPLRFDDVSGELR